MKIQKKYYKKILNNKMIKKMNINLIKNLILILVNYQEKEDLVKLENVKVNQIIIMNMQLN